MTYPMTIYELSSSDGEPTRYFGPSEHTDACVRASERILDLDRDASVGGGYVHLKRLPDSIYPDGVTLLAWTKTSNERPTLMGAVSVEELT